MARTRSTPLLTLFAAALLGAGLTGCADDASNLVGTTGGMTGGTTAGNTAGDTGGDTAGNTAGNTAGDTGGNTAGDTAGDTGGDTGGDTSGTTAGDTGGDTGGTTGDVVGGIICNPTSSTFRPIVLPNATAVASIEGLCVGCSVTSPVSVIDDDPATFGVLNTPVGLLGGSSVLTVNDTATIYPAGRRAGFTIFDPSGGLLTLTLLQTLTVTVSGNGGTSETADTTVLALDLLGTPIIGNNDARFLSFVPQIDFNTMSLQFGGVANVLAQIGVFQACVSVDPAVLP